MADLVSSLRTFPPTKELSPLDYHKRAHDYVKKVNTISDSKFTSSPTLFDQLNPAENSIAYLYALVHHAEAVGKDRKKAEDVINHAAIFFASFDPVQIRYADEAWQKLLAWVFGAYPQLDITDCSPLTTAMLRLDPAGATFTLNHLRLLRQCLHSGSPGQALPVLDKNILAFPQTNPKAVDDELLCADHELSNAFITAKSGFVGGNIKPEHLLEYYLLGAHIYIGLRNFSRARLFLEHILLAPTLGNSCSALQTEAYKKWLLIGLLAQGKGYPLPRTHNQAVFKSVKAIGKPYEALAESFEKRAWRKFQAEAEVGMQIWYDDGNTRLVKEVGDALMRYRVLDLQKTFAALPIQRVADHLSLPLQTTNDLLTSMLEQGYINGQLTTASNQPVLQFHDSAPTDITSTDSLEAQTQRIQTLISAIRDADRRLQLSKEYVEVQKRNKRSGGPEGDLADQMDLTYDAPIAGLDDDDGGFGGGSGMADEDIMER